MSLNNVKLSVITVNLNNVQGLEKTIKSVINQTFSNLEYIVIDGGSTDNSVDIINTYKDQISYWISESDNGIYHAMNKGIKQASGEYCLFLNSGDLLIKETIIDNIFSLQFNEDIVTGSMVTYSNENNTHKYYESISEINLNALLRKDLWHQATFIKRQLFEDCGLYDETNKIVSDKVFFIKAILIHKASVKIIPYIITLFNEDGISMKYFKNKDFTEYQEAIQNILPVSILEDPCLMNSEKWEIMNKYMLTRTIAKFILFFNVKLNHSQAAKKRKLNHALKRQRIKLNDYEKNL